MITTLITFLIVLLLVVAAVYCLRQAATVFPGIPAPIINIAVVIVFIILFAFLLNYMGYGAGLGH